MKSYFSARALEGASSDRCAFLAGLSATLILVALLVAPAFRIVSAHGGEDDEKPAASTVKPGAPVAAVRTAERNVQTEGGQFRVRLRQTPTDPRAGEEAQFAVDLSEQVEGGFGGEGGMQPLEGANVTARVTTAAGQAVADKLATHAEPDGSYGVHYAFGSSGEYKIIFDVRASDGRQFAADFPVSIIPAPTNWFFWLGLAALALVSAGAIFGYYNSWKRGDAMPANAAARKTIPVAVAALLFFGVGTAALAYFAPPRERRAIAHLPSATAADTSNTVAATGDPSLGGSGATITIPKESQLLFNIRTEPVTERQITGGLKVTGTVQTRPDAQAVISPPVSGRVLFGQGITIGAAVGRGQRIGTIEQVLGAPEQAGLEAQRIQLRTAALEQQARQAAQNALAQQARTRLAQAQRELQRSTNLLEVGAAARRRVEEAQTAVRLAEQEVASAEQQARVASQQVRVAQEGVARVDPVRTFPLVSPVTGIVTDLKVTTGQQVEAGAQLLNVVNLSTVFLQAQVFEKDLPAVRESRRATYTAAGIPDEVYAIGKGGDGRLVTIGQAVDPQTRTVPVIFEVPNPSNRLRDGMFVEITIDTTGNNSVLSVPKQSVITEQGRTFVFVFKGGERFEKRIVVVGSEGQDFYEIKSGIQPGERVVVEGIYQLRSTQPGA